MKSLIAHEFKNIGKQGIELESLIINGNVYHIRCVPFEDKSEQDKARNYEYYYKGRNISVCWDKECIGGRMYDEEDAISFFQNPIFAFGEDFQEVKRYLGKEYGIRRFKFLDRESEVSVYREL